MFALPPLASAECGLLGEFGLEPTTHGPGVLNMSLEDRW